MFNAAAIVDGATAIPHTRQQIATPLSRLAVTSVWDSNVLGSISNMGFTATYGQRQYVGAFESVTRI